MGVAYEQLIAGYDTVIAGFRGLLAEVGPERETFGFMFTTIGGYFHGIDHWARVGMYGLAIGRGLREQGRVDDAALAAEGALEDAVVYAAFFHDCGRINEGDDFAHGKNGERIWRHYAERKGLAVDLVAGVSQALLFHVDHPSVDPDANPVTVCLCNADRLDRIRLNAPGPGEPVILEHVIDPERMYPDNVWRELFPHSLRLFHDYRLARVNQDLNLVNQ